MKKIKNIVFDLGGVVLDWNPVRMRNEYTGKPELTEFLFANNGLHSCWHEFDRGTYTEEKMIEQLAEISGMPAGDCSEFMAYIKASLTDIPETVALIRQLSAEGYRLFCLSNLSHSFYDYLSGRDFFHYFEGRIISAQEGVIKPEPAIYRILTSRFGLEPEETLFIDDLKANVNAAAGLGFRTVHFTGREKGYREIAALLK